MPAEHLLALELRFESKYDVAEAFEVVDMAEGIEGVGRYKELLVLIKVIAEKRGVEQNDRYNAQEQLSTGDDTDEELIERADEFLK